MNDFKYLYRNIKSQLSPFYDKSVNFFYGDKPLENYGLCPTQHIVNISTQLRLIAN